MCTLYAVITNSLIPLARISFLAHTVVPNLLSSVKNVRTEIMYIIFLSELLLMCFETWSHIKGVRVSENSVVRKQGPMR